MILISKRNSEIPGVKLSRSSPACAFYANHVNHLVIRADQTNYQFPIQLLHCREYDFVNYSFDKICQIIFQLNRIPDVILTSKRFDKFCKYILSRYFPHL